MNSTETPSTSIAYRNAVKMAAEGTRVGAHPTYQAELEKRAHDLYPADPAPAGTSK